MQRTLIALFLVVLVHPILAQNEDRGSIYPRLIVFDEPIPQGEVISLLRNTFRLQAKEDFQFLETSADQLGFRHLTFQQQYSGLDVDGGLIKVHLKDGFIHSISGNYLDIENEVSISPSISADQAFQLAYTHVNAKVHAWDNNGAFPVPQLIISADPKGVEPARLGYKMDFYALKPLFRADIVMDAQTGKFISQNEKIHATDVQGRGQSLYNGTVSFTTNLLNGVHSLKQTRSGKGIATYSMNQGTDYSKAEEITSFSSTFYNATGVQAHWGAEQTYNYLFSKHNRNSFDGKGAQIRSYVSYDSNYVNAFWDGAKMTYGDGNGTSFGPMVSLDIVAHEIIHGLTDHSADLVYRYESGALNESFSDIFGEAIEHYATGSTNWRIGSDVGINRDGAIRSLADPKEFRDPDTYDGTYWYTGVFDNGGVHINSGVQNKWFYLLAQGGSGINDHGRTYAVQGIGIEKAADIAFRNLTVYLSPFSEYQEARDGAVQAAIDLFGTNSQEVLSTMAAWEAVGVGENTDPYCRSRGTNATQEWIASVEMSGFINNSIGAGYSNFSNKVIDVQGGRSHVISLVPGYRNRQTHAWWAIWIDYNGDGDFYDANEEVFVSDTLYSGQINREIFIRNGAVSPSRMRIAMKWGGQAPTPCEIFPFGEVEDYSIAFDGVAPPQTCQTPSGLNARNVGIDNATLAWSSVAGVNQYRLKYREVGTANWRFRNVIGLSVALSSLSEQTSYEAQISSFCGGVYSDYSSSVIFTTTSCNEVLSNATFESGWGIWNDGGSDAQREFNPSIASGNYLIRLRDNSSSSVVLSDPINLSTYASVEVSFTYLTQSFDNSNEDFLLELSNDLQNYSTVGTWTYGTDFQNNQKSYAQVKIEGPFAANTRLRIRCDASDNGDLLFIDDIVIAACSGANNPPPPPVCNVPTNLLASNITTTAATLTWSADANSYNLRYRKVGQSTWISRNTSARVYNLSSLEDGSNYEVQLRAVCSSGTSAYSASLVFRTEDIPQACTIPSNLSVANISTSGATVTWNAASTANNYTLRYRRSGTTSWTQLNTSNRSRSLSGLSSGASYQVQVRSNCTGQSSAYSAIQQFTTLQTCSTPSNLSVTNLQTTAAQLSWSSANGAIAYTLRYRRVGTTSWSTIDVASTSRSISNLQTNTNYEAQVRSLCQGNNTTAYSNSLNFKTGAVSSPTGCNETVNSNGFESTWGIWNDGGSDASRVFDPSKASSGNYSVRLRDNTVSSVMISDPVDISAYNSVELGFSFMAISFDNNTERFVLEMADNSANFQEVQAWNFQTHFSNNAPYDAKVTIAGPFSNRVRFRIRCDASANDDLIYIDNVTINACTGTSNPPAPTVCNTPENATVSGISHNQASFSWTGVATAQGYRLRYRAIGRVSWQNINTSNTNYTIANLSPETNYEVQVSTICGDGNSNYSGSRTFRTTAAPLNCAVPSGLQVENTSTNGAQVTWGAVPNATSYSIRYRRLGTNTWTVRSANSTVYNISALSPNTSYQVQVSTNCNGEQSTYSSSRTFTTEAEVLVCDVPQNLRVANIQTRSATLNWSANATYQSYTIRYRQQGSSTWTSLSSNASSLVVSSLNPATNYEVQIRGRCQSGDYSSYSNVLSFSTLPEETVPDAPSDCNVNINANNFERSWGIWNDGGSDSRRTFNPARAIGNYSVQLRDNTSSSVTVCDPLDLSAYASIQFSFTFIAEGFSSTSEGLILEQSYAFGPYEKVKKWEYSQDFSNLQRVNANFELSENLDSRVRFRFRATGNSDNQKIHIDEIQILACPRQSANSIANDSRNAAVPIADINQKQVSQATANLQVAVPAQYHLQLFPNPVKERLMIQLKTDRGEAFHRLAIFDSNGRLVLQQPLNQRHGLLQSSVEVNALSRGVYVIRIIGSQQNYQRRFVVQ